MSFPIDAVITWVDGKDDLHHQKMLPYLKNKSVTKNKEFRTRLDQVEEIKYAVNSILKYAGFIRNIFIVTDNQVPKFIKNKEEGTYENVFIIDHKDIFKEDSIYLPVFSNRPIEAKLYNIPGLAEHFIYLNDDMFLLKETKMSDYFIDGKPVIRGKWLKFEEEKIYKKIFPDSDKTKPKHKRAQQKAAEVVGFKKQFYRFQHIPAPLRKSTFKTFFKNNRDIEIDNVKHKFRDVSQFTAQGLANHIEIKNNTCTLKKDYKLIYIHKCKPYFWAKFKLNILSKKENKLFLNMQSLDQRPEKKLVYLLNWLEKKYRLKK
ncbi:Stealth CR1 domain-containing protein [Tenacibaculum retecalamus]|uniref:Stealth CR1 domain-containing protein n=1 Tax=Tenacibaculum retecalamus TaxID=3018315 RepID=UPI0023D90ED9|nr:Stealth CR1 domain-containing protein [Tenacibaculum retecalamus]WBX70089.1 Stealth CR1 domain-containing protein [Tenacibaculum retecalamus]